MKVKGPSCWGGSLVSAGRSRPLEEQGGRSWPTWLVQPAPGVGSLGEDAVEVACQWRLSSETRTADRVSLDARRQGMFGSLMLPIEPQRSLWDLSVRGIRVQESRTRHFLPERLDLHL